MKKRNDMQRLRGHLEKNWELRIEYLKYQIHVIVNKIPDSDTFKYIL